VDILIPTFNEAGHIAQVVKNAGALGPVFVLDSHSTDGTQELAASHGARVVQRDWMGFGRQKQHAVAAARNDWVLCLDADERVTPALERSIRAALAGDRHRAWRLARRNRFLGRWLAHGEGYPDWQLRLFHRAHASWSNDEVHESVLTTAETGQLDGDLLHDSAEDVATYMAKQYRYSTLHAEALYRQGVRAGYWRLAASPLMRFVKFYILRLGFLDGGPGFAHIVIGCNNTFHKYLKLIELGRNMKGERA